LAAVGVAAILGSIALENILQHGQSLLGISVFPADTHARLAAFGIFIDRGDDLRNLFHQIFVALTITEAVRWSATATTRLRFLIR